MVERMQKLSARPVRTQEQPQPQAAEVAQPTDAGAQPQLVLPVPRVALPVRQAFQLRA
jgi:hypothetical protein